MRRLIAGTFLVVLTIATGQVLYWLTLDAAPTITDMRAPIVLTPAGKPTATVRAGEHILVSRYFCRHRMKEGRVIITWEDGIRYELPGDVAGKPGTDLGCYQRVRSFVVPPIPPGLYTRRSVHRQWYNPILGWREIELPPAHLEVLP